MPCSSFTRPCRHGRLVALEVGAGVGRGRGRDAVALLVLHHPVRNLGLVALDVRAHVHRWWRRAFAQLRPVQEVVDLLNQVEAGQRLALVTDRVGRRGRWDGEAELPDREVAFGHRRLVPRDVQALVHRRRDHDALSVHERVALGHGRLRSVQVRAHVNGRRENTVPLLVLDHPVGDLSLVALDVGADVGRGHVRLRARGHVRLRLPDVVGQHERSSLRVREVRADDYRIDLDRVDADADRVVAGLQALVDTRLADVLADEDLPLAARTDNHGRARVADVDARGRGAHDGKRRDHRQARKDSQASQTPISAAMHCSSPSTRPGRRDDTRLALSTRLTV